MNLDRNTILAFALALLVVIGWEYFAPKHTQPVPAPVSSTAAPAAIPAPGAEAALPKGMTPADVKDTPAEREHEPEQRIKIETANLSGSLTLTGGRFDDISLVRYHDTTDPKSPEIVLLSPTISPKPYYAEFGWIGTDSSVALPNAATKWTIGNPDTVLTDTTPVVLTWDNGDGLRFVRTIKVDSEYLFTVEQTIENTGSKPVTLFPYSLISRADTPPGKGVYLLHEGPIGVFDGTLKEENYADVKKAKDGRIAMDSTGGWIGITDKYWLAAVAFDPAMKVSASFNYANPSGRDRYQTDLRGDGVTIAPAEKKSVTGYLFAGAKKIEVLDAYTKTPGITLLDRAIDFGWFWFLTIPFFHALQWLHGALGNFGLAILAFSTFVRLLMFPIANKGYASMNNMKRLQPKMKALQERHANDKTKLNQEMMELYRREKINPLGGCLPILVQFPVFFALYKVLYVTIEMRHAPFYGWIHDLSAADPTSMLNLFGLLPYSIPPILMFASIGAWPLIYGVTMFLQQRLSPQMSADPVQAKIMMYMPVIFTFVVATMPAGLAIYWAWSNLLGILQQWILLKRSPAKT